MMRIREVNINQLNPSPYNPRVDLQPGDQAYRKLEASIRAFDYVEPIVWNERTGNVVSGHQRLKVLREMGVTRVGVSVVDLDEASEKAMNVALNKISGEWDIPKLQDVLSAISRSGIDEGLTGFDVEELESLICDDEPVQEPSPGRMSEAKMLQDKWNTSRGQIWSVGKHRILCGDSTVDSDVDALLGGEKIGTVLFDPPYDADDRVLGVRWRCNDALVFTDHRHLLDCVSGWPRFRCLFAWDCITSWYTPGWPLARGKFCLWFGNSDYNSEGAYYGEPGKARIVSNPRGTYQYRPNPKGKHLSTVFRSHITREYDGHPHAKPVVWLAMLIANCTTGLVFDPFLGGGSSILASESLGRTCLGIEVDPGYVAVACERFSGEGLEPRLLGRIND